MYMYMCTHTHTHTLSEQTINFLPLKFLDNFPDRWSVFGGYTIGDRK